MNDIASALLWSAAGLVASACWSEGGPLSGMGGNDGVCAGADCVDMVSIQISRRDELLFQPGEYQFQVEIERENPMVTTCTLSQEASFSCSGPSRMSVRLNSDFDIFTIKIEDAAPEQLLVAVLLDDGEIGEDLLTPDYEYIVGDDPDCMETCMQGNVEMRVASGS